MSDEGRTELVDADYETGTFRTTYDYPSNPPSAAIATALRAVTDRDVTELAPMYKAANVDPDALDELFRPLGDGRPRRGRVTFTYCGFTVIVESYGRVVVRSSDER